MGTVDAAEADIEVETSTQSGTQPDDAEGIRDTDRRQKLKRRRASKQLCARALSRLQSRPEHHGPL